MSQIRAQKAGLRDFTNISKLQNGAYGTVFKVVHKVSGMTFALKQIPKKIIKDAKMLTQLNNQIKILYSIKHNNVVRLNYHFEQQDSYYLVLQYAAKGSLYKKLQSAGKLNQRFVRKALKQVLSALQCLHQKDPPIIHRDIKPQNILLDNLQNCKLADFGWSNFHSEKRVTFCGTSEYLAPQMIRESGHDCKLDIWCVGVLAFELLAGKTPFVPLKSADLKSRQRQLISNIENMKYQFPQQITGESKKFIEDCLKSDPAERPAAKQLLKHPFIYDSLSTATLPTDNHRLDKAEKANAVTVSVLKKELQMAREQLGVLKGKYESCQLQLLRVRQERSQQLEQALRKVQMYKNRSEKYKALIQQLQQSKMTTHPLAQIQQAQAQVLAHIHQQLALASQFGRLAQKLQEEQVQVDRFLQQQREERKTQSSQNQKQIKDRRRQP